MPRKGTGTTDKPDYPLFREYTLDFLLERLGYSPEYLLDIRRGRSRPTKRFRKTACGILGRDERALFGERVAEGE